MKVSDETIDLNIIDMDSMDTNVLPVIDEIPENTVQETSDNSDDEAASQEETASYYDNTPLTPLNKRPRSSEDLSATEALEIERILEATETVTVLPQNVEDLSYSEAPASEEAVYEESENSEQAYSESAEDTEEPEYFDEEDPVEDTVYEEPAPEEAADSYQEEPSSEEPLPDEPSDNGSDPAGPAPETDTPAKSSAFVWPDRSGSRMIPVYFVMFFATILYYELLLRIDISGSFSRANLPLLAFIPAQALFLTALTGFFKNHPRINGIISAVLIFCLGFYYFAQLIYSRMSGSLLSVSLMNMGGEAMGNFGWTIKDILIRSIPHLLLMTIPLIVCLVLSFIHLPSEKEGNAALLPGGAYKLWLHPLCLAAALGLWTIGGLCLALAGRDRDSAYYVFKDPYSDTDSSSLRLGSLTTTLVEASSYYLGTDSDNGTAIAAVDMAAIDLGKKSSPAPVTQIPDSVSASAVSENEVEVRRVPDHAWENEQIDFTALKELSTDATTTSLCDYFASRVPTRTNEQTGLFEDYNLIYICAEAFSNYGIDEDITPTLYKMANNGVVLNNFYNSFPNTTTNGEFAFATSLWPDVSRFAQSGTAVGSFPQSANTFMPYGLGDLFTTQGVESYAYHNYYGDYYKRCYSWPNLGYTHMKFLGSGMVFTSSWPASDLELIKQSIDDYIDKDRFNAYYMTFSGHGPYNAGNYMYRKNIEEVKARANGKYKMDECLGYFCGEYELELAMEYLLERLEEEDKLDNTVIVLIGDHFPYYLSDQACTELNGGTLDPIEKNHSTCIIYNAGLEEPLECDTYCCNVDILPTILNLFNIEFDSRMYMGTDVFSDGIHRARLYNGSFLTEYVTYDKATGKKTWTDAAGEFSEKELDAYFEAMLDYTTSEYSAALNMMKSNFYLFTWKNSGLLSTEEVNEELAREENGRRIYADEAAAEAARLEAEAAAAAAAEAAAAEAAAQQQEQQNNNNNEEEYHYDPDPDPNWQPDPSWFED